MLRGMIRIRGSRRSGAELYSASRIRGFLHLCIGEEAVAVGVVGALEDTDSVVSTYREHGHALARGVPMTALMSEMFGKATGCSHGRGGSMHLFDTSRRFFGGNAIVAGGIPLAVGLALADRLRGGSAVTACLFGDGAFAEGEWHESANLAALWHLPVLFCCENNRYAMGTALAREHAETDLAARAAGYGMVAWAVDGMDPVAVRDATTRAWHTCATAAPPASSSCARTVPRALDVRPRPVPREDRGRGLAPRRPDPRADGIADPGRCDLDWGRRRLGGRGRGRARRSHRCRRCGAGRAGRGPRALPHDRAGCRRAGRQRARRRRAGCQRARVAGPGVAGQGSSGSRS